MTTNDLNGVQTPDFSFAYEDFHGNYLERAHEQARLYYDAIGIARDDKARRQEAYLRNYQF